MSVYTTLASATTTCEYEGKCLCLPGIISTTIMLLPSSVTLKFKGSTGWTALCGMMEMAL